VQGIKAKNPKRRGCGLRKGAAREEENKKSVGCGYSFVWPSGGALPAGMKEMGF
jgi:hypothetical protein